MRTVNWVKGPVVIALMTLASITILEPTRGYVQGNAVGLVEDVGGVVTIRRHGGEPRPLVPSENLVVRDHIETASESKVRVRFSGDAIGILGDRAVMAISGQSGSTVLDLDSGALYYRVSGQWGRPEPEAVRTPNVIARTTGSFVARVRREPSAGIVTTTICVFDDQASIAVIDGVTLQILEGNCVDVSGNSAGQLFPVPAPPPLVPLSNILS